MSDLTEFLLARIAEDEATAHEGRVVPSVTLVKVSPAVEVWQDSGRAVRVGDIKTIRVSRGRILAECEAKRRIIEYVVGIRLPSTDLVLPIMATAYADHPDYQEEWKR